MCYFKLTHYLLNDCFFPNRTIPLGGKLTLNKDFSSPLSGSHPFFSSFPHIPPPSGFLILFSDLCIRIPSFPIPPSSFFFIIFLLCFFFSSSILPLCYLLSFTILYIPPSTFSLFLHFAILTCCLSCPTQSIPHKLHPEQSRAIDFSYILDCSASLQAKTLTPHLSWGLIQAACLSPLMLWTSHPKTLTSWHFAPNCCWGKPGVKAQRINTNTSHRKPVNIWEICLGLFPSRCFLLA